MRTKIFPTQSFLLLIRTLTARTITRTGIAQDIVLKAVLCILYNYNAGMLIEQDGGIDISIVTLVIDDHIMVEM
jgi:hypothetical protein